MFDSIFFKVDTLCRIISVVIHERSAFNEAEQKNINFTNVSDVKMLGKMHSSRTILPILRTLLGLLLAIMALRVLSAIITLLPPFVSSPHSGDIRLALTLSGGHRHALLCKAKDAVGRVS